MTRDDDLFPELAGGLVGSLPGGGVLSVVVERATGAVLREWRRNLSVTLQLACEYTGMSREDLAEKLELESNLAPLFIRVLYAAGMNGNDKTLRMLAGFLGDAVADLSRVDEIALLLAAVSDFTEHHIKVLELLEKPPAQTDGLRDTEVAHWTTGLLVRVSDMRPEIALAAARGLLRAGLLDDIGLDGGGVTSNDLKAGGTILAITELGQTVLEVLRTVPPLD